MQFLLRKEHIKQKTSVKNAQLNFDGWYNAI